MFTMTAKIAWTLYTGSMTSLPSPGKEVFVWSVDDQIKHALPRRGRLSALEGTVHWKFDGQTYPVNVDDLWGEFNPWPLADSYWHQTDPFNLRLRSDGWALYSREKGSGRLFGRTTLWIFGDRAGITAKVVEEHPEYEFLWVNNETHEEEVWDGSRLVPKGSTSTMESTKDLPIAFPYQVEYAHISYDTGLVDEWHYCGEPQETAIEAIDLCEEEMGGTYIRRRVRNTSTGEIVYWQDKPVKKGDIEDK